MTHTNKGYFIFSVLLWVIPQMDESTDRKSAVYSSHIDYPVSVNQRRVYSIFHIFQDFFVLVVVLCARDDISSGASEINVTLSFPSKYSVSICIGKK